MKNSSIRKKIVYLFIPLTLIPFVVFSLLTITLYGDSLINETIDNITDNSEIINNQLEDMFSGIEDASNMATFRINSIFKEYQEKDGYNYLAFELDIIGELYDLMITFSDIKSITFIDENDIIYATDARIYDNYSEVIKSDMLKSLEETTGISKWYPIENREFLNSTNGPILTIGKKIIDIESGETLGYLFVNIEEKTISNYLSTANTSYELIQDQVIVSSNNKENILTTIPHEEIPKSNYKIVGSKKNQEVIVKSNVGKLNWLIIGRTSLNEINESIDKTAKLMMYLVLAIVCIQIIVANRISNYIINPINQMKDKMVDLGDGNFDIHFDIDSKDEIGMFARKFNRMSEKIKTLLVEVENKEKAKREYELALMFEQVKPHFLYNTLDTIYALSEMGRKKEVLKAINSLGEYYRKTLSSGKEIITIKEEIDALKGYLYLQRLQYSDSFDYELEISEDIFDYQIIKVTIQPIVENAIYHGIKESEEFGKLKISALKNGDEHVRIIVEDNGVGMSKEKIETLLSYTKYENDDHFGLVCVRDRLKLHYGSKSKFEVRSELGKGTKVIVDIPLIGKDE